MRFFQNPFALGINRVSVHMHWIMESYQTEGCFYQVRTQNFWGRGKAEPEVIYNLFDCKNYKYLIVNITVTLHFWQLHLYRHSYMFFSSMTHSPNFSHKIEFFNDIQVVLNCLLYFQNPNVLDTADVSGWFQLKGKQRKRFDIILPMTLGFFNFRYGLLQSSGHPPSPLWVRPWLPPKETRQVDGSLSENFSHKISVKKIPAVFDSRTSVFRQKVSKKKSLDWGLRIDTCVLYYAFLPTSK